MISAGRVLLRVFLGRTTRRRRKVSRGQALVEFALFVPLLLFMVVGATDISTLLDDHLNVVYAARTGARVGSVIGSYSPTSAPYTADCAVIGAVQAALVNSPNVQVNWIAIYQADATGVYTSKSPQDRYPGSAVCNSDGTISQPAIQTTWAPNTPRSTKPFLEDSLGVAINYTYTFQFNPLGVQFNPQGGGAFTATDSSVMPIEIVIGTPPAITPPPTSTP